MCYKKLSLVVCLVLWAAPLAAQTDTPTDTPTATPTVTATGTKTATVTKTVTLTRTPLSDDTPTRTSTRTFTATPVPNTPTITATPVPGTATRTVTPTATRTGVPHLQSYSSAGCLQLTLSPQMIGGSNRRRGFSFWAYGAEMWCGYNPDTLSQTPCEDCGAHYADGQGLNKCDCQDADLYCIGDGQVCWDQCAEVTPTSTATATATPTPA